MAAKDTQEQVIDTASQEQPVDDLQEGQVETPFHTYEDQVFKTPDELNSYIKKGIMFQSDYTKKTQGLSDERKRYENERSEFNRSRQDFDEKRKSYSKYEEFDKLLQRNPQLMRQWQQYITQAPKGSDVQSMIDKVLEEKVNPKLKEIEEAEKRKQAEDEKRRHYGELK